MFKREGYVNEAGQPIVHKEIDPRKAGIVLCAIVLVISMIIFIVLAIKKSNKNKTCNKIEDVFSTAAMEYVSKNGTLPKAETDSVTVTSDELLKDGRINAEEITLDENVCKAKITITKYHATKKDKEHEYIKNVELENCGYCSTDERYGKEITSSKFPSGHTQIKVEPTFNFYETSDYYTRWTPYLKEEQLAKEKSKYGVVLPESKLVLPPIPDTGHILTIEKDDKTYYRYRDKKWKFYKNANASYSGYSSTQPKGYSNRDDASSRKTDWSAWSLNYPDTATYRIIRTQTGYRWYYKEGNKKIYWKSGEFYPEQPDEKYTEKGNKATMYSYQDTQWRWYNGTAKRLYSGYYPKAPSGYRYRDDENTSISNWSGWYEESHTDSSNSYYREQVTEVRSRYRIKYQVYSLLKLDNYVDKKTFEEQVGKNYTDFYFSDHIKVDVKYKYKYRKVK